MQHERPHDAERLITQLLTPDNPDAGLYRLLAEANQQQQRIAETHFYLAEYYAQLGMFSEAIIQIQLALAQSNLSSTQKIRYEARQQALDKELAEQREKERK